MLVLDTEEDAGRNGTRVLVFSEVLRNKKTVV